MLCALSERTVVILAASDEAAEAVVLVAVFLKDCVRRISAVLLCQRAGGVVNTIYILVL